MLCLVPCEFYLTELSLDSSAPGGSSFLDQAIFCHVVSNAGQSILSILNPFSFSVAQPSDLPAFDAHVMPWQPQPRSQGLSSYCLSPSSLQGAVRLETPGTRLWLPVFSVKVFEILFGRFLSLMPVQYFPSIGLGTISNDLTYILLFLFVLSFLFWNNYKNVQVRFIVMPSYLSQGEAGPPSEKELVSNAVQQAIAPTGTVYFMLSITLDTLPFKYYRVYKWSDTIEMSAC